MFLQSRSRCHGFTVLSELISLYFLNQDVAGETTHSRDASCREVENSWFD